MLVFVLRYLLQRETTRKKCSRFDANRRRERENGREENEVSRIRIKREKGEKRDRGGNGGRKKERNEGSRIRIKRKRREEREREMIVFLRYVN